ncbi:hypothetical protein Tco_1409728 [Tanacetum coccineum]
MGRDTIQLDNAVSTISQEYLLEFTSEYGIPEGLHPELPGPEDTIVDFSEGKVGMYTKFFEFANFRIPISQFLFDILGYYQIHISQLSVIGAAKANEIVFPTVMDWRASAPKDEMPTTGSYLAANVAMLNTRLTPIQKQPEALLCLVGLSRNYLLGDDENSVVFAKMDLFNLISAPNPSKVKTGIRPRVAHEVLLMTVTANQVIEMKDPSVASGSSGTPSTVERSPLDFDNENPAPSVTEGTEAEEQAHDGLAHEEPPKEPTTTTEVAQEVVLEEEVAAVRPLGSKRRKQLRRKRANEEVEVNAPPKETPAVVSDPDPLSYAKPQSIPEQDVVQSSRGEVVAGDPNSEKSTSFTSLTGSPSGIYQLGWGVTNSCRLDTPEACQDMVDHIVPPGYFSELRHLPNEDILSQYMINLARQVALGSQLRLRFEQENRLLKRATEKVTKRDQRIQAREEEVRKLEKEVKSLRVADAEVQGLRNQTKNLETLLEAEVDIKKATEAKNAELGKELESLRAKLTELQLNNHQLSQQVSTLQAQVTGEERIKAAFKDFKRLENEKVEQRCAEMDARLDALSIDFDEELYPHMLTAISGSRWVIGHGLRLAVMKCAESTDLRQAFADAVSTRIVKGMSEELSPYCLKDMKYPLVDQLEQLKDAPIDLLMASLHLESDTGEDAPPFIRDLRPSSSQLKIHVSDGVPVSVPTVIPQGLQILLEDAATKTKLSEDEASPKLIRSKSLPAMYNLNWP